MYNITAAAGHLNVDQILFIIHDKIIHFHLFEIILFLIIVLFISLENVYMYVFDITIMNSLTLCNNIMSIKGKITDYNNNNPCIITIF